jgi:hypothetical protein
MSVAEPSKPSSSPAVKPSELPSPDQIRPMPDDVMNWDKKSLGEAPPPRDGARQQHS